MGSNFECDHCKIQFFVPQYSVIINRNQPSTYVNKQGSIQCPECKSTKITYVSTGEICINVGKYSSASWGDKKAMLNRRAKQAMRKDAEQRHEIDKNFCGRVNESHY